MRQCLVPAPLGHGRPYWVDDADFDIAHHVRVVGCPAPGDEQALLRVAAEAITAPLPRDRPLWAATIVTGVDPDTAAVVFVFHHVLADGIGGLAVLANLVDGVAITTSVDFPRPTPSRWDLLIDALRSRMRAVGHLPTAVHHVGDAIAALRLKGQHPAPKCDLNRPIGSKRAFAVARVRLADVAEVAHANDATVNDVVLLAATHALHQHLRARGEQVDEFVVSIPVSGRRATTRSHLGNEVGIIPVRVPAVGDPVERLRSIAQITREGKAAPRAASAALLSPVFRMLAKLHILRWFIQRQRLVNTFVTNLRGPTERLSFLGAPITDVIALTAIAGNVTIAFAALSYAGTLSVTVIVDPVHCPELPALTAALQRELDALIDHDEATGSPGDPSAPGSLTALSSQP